MKRVKNLSKKKLNQMITEDRIKDEKALIKILQLEEQMIDICHKDDVEPETLLCELYFLMIRAESVLMGKHTDKAVEPGGAPLTKKEIKSLDRNLERLKGEILKQSLMKINYQAAAAYDKVRESGHKGDLKGSESDGLPYQPSKERPYYIT